MIEDETEETLRDNVEHAIAELGYALSRAMHRAVQDEIGKLRAGLAAEREREADETAAYFREAIRKLDTERVEG